MGECTTSFLKIVKFLIGKGLGGGAERNVPVYITSFHFNCLHTHQDVGGWGNFMFTFLYNQF